MTAASMPEPPAQAIQPTLPEVPQACCGVWERTLLETPTMRDTTSFVRWLQTPLWHADLRIPLELQDAAAARAASPLQRASLTGFCGVTQVTHGAGDALSVCQWHRRVDLQPPALLPDAGTLWFETPDRLIERGVHATYLEVWERLPGTAMSFEVHHGDREGACLLRAGGYAMRVLPRRTPWPAGTAAGDSLALVLQRHPAQAAVLLDFEISCGPVRSGLWHIEQSTLPQLLGSQVAWDAEVARWS